MGSGGGTKGVGAIIGLSEKRGMIGGIATVLRPLQYKKDAVTSTQVCN